MDSIVHGLAKSWTWLRDFLLSLFTIAREMSALPSYMVSVVIMMP